MRAELFTAVALTLFAAPALAEPTARECIDVNERSIQLRDAHALHDALGKLLVCANPSCPTEIRGECERRLAVVTNEIPSVVFAAKDAAGHDLVAVRVLVDGATVTEKLDGTPLVLDPGTHHFRFEASGEGPIETSALIREGEKNRPIRVTIGAPASPTPVEQRRNPTFRIAGIAAGVLGLGGLVVGALTGFVANDAWSRSQRECATPTNCADYSKAVADHNTASDFATVSTIAFVAGGISLAVGGVLFFAAPVVKPGPAATTGVTLGARF